MIIAPFANVILLATLSEVPVSSNAALFATVTVRCACA